MSDAITLPVTSAQVEGLKVRQSALDRAEMAQREYIAAILDGHGIQGVQVVSVNDETMTLTVQPLSSPSTP